MINVKVSIDRLIVTPLTNRLIISDSVGFVYADFIFDDEWQNLTKTATFSAGNEAYDVLLTGDRCEIPHELLTDGAEIRIAVKGYAEDVIVVTKAMNSAIKVWAAGIHEGTQPGAYTPELWEQVLQKLESKQNTLIAGRNITLEEQTDGTVKISATGGGGGSSEAVDIHIEDEEDYYTSNNVEGALQEVGQDIGELGADIQDIINDVDAHVENVNIHVTTTDKANWNIKYTKPSTGIPASDLADGVIPTVPTQLSQLTADSTHRTVTDTEKSTWNGKQDVISDLTTIRSGAEKGNTAYQKPSTGIPASDLAIGVIPETEQATELSVDAEVTQSSDNLITSGAVYDYISSLNGNEVSY